MTDIEQKLADLAAGVDQLGVSRKPIAYRNGWT